MKKDMIQEIENKLNIKLPSDYQKILLNYPKELLNHESLSIDKDDEGPASLQLINNHNVLIELNISTRELYKKDNDFLWQKNYLQIGVDGCGGIFYIRIDEKHSAVYFYHWEDGIEKHSTSIKKFVKDIVIFYRETFLE